MLKLEGRLGMGCVPLGLVAALPRLSQRMPHPRMHRLLSSGCRSAGAGVGFTMHARSPRCPELKTPVVSILEGPALVELGAWLWRMYSALRMKEAGYLSKQCRITPLLLSCCGRAHGLLSMLDNCTLLPHRVRVKNACVHLIAQFYGSMVLDMSFIMFYFILR